MPGPRIGLYEYCTSGGLRRGDVRDAGLLAEGRAMARALAEDFAAAGCDVSRLIDAELAHQEPECPGVRRILVEAGQERALLQAAASDADWALVIAPECEGLLAERFDWVAAAGGRWLGCDRELIEIAADKHRTAQWLLDHKVPAPRGWKLKGAWPEACPIPAVLKPLDGAGSEGVRRLDRPLESNEIQMLAPGRWRVEPWMAGLPASVAVLSGPQGQFALAPCQQEIISDPDGGLTYVGGGLPLTPELARRAQRLARAAVRALPNPCGYIGVDLVLGADESQDFVIEINPRLTTSYVGLRAACRQNLAQALLDVAEGRSVELEFDPQPIRFQSDGAILQGAKHELAGT